MNSKFHPMFTDDEDTPMQRVRQQIEAEWEQINNESASPYPPDWASNPITVAVLDTGIGRHPDLAGKILAFEDFVKQRQLMYDKNGHGTHVSGILCGDGSCSQGRMRGIAPGARLVVGKVLDDKGDGLADNMIRALEWVLRIKDQYQIQILNISVGMGSLSHPSKENALREMVEEAWNQGIVVICAAGNKGPNEGSLSCVGSCDKVIVVGCHDGGSGKYGIKTCESYSGRGITGAFPRKPDLVAPGSDITSCNVGVSKVYGVARNPYLTKSGTSMATPIVSGAAALFLQKYPGADNETIKDHLHYSAIDLGENWNLQGWGMLNVRRFLNW